MADDPNTSGNAGGTPADSPASQQQQQPPAGASGGTPPAGAPNNSGANSSGGSDSTETISLDEARKLRSEAAGLRRRLKEFEDAKLTETEKLQKAAEEAATERDTLRAENRRLKALSAVASSGALYPDLVADKLTDDDLADAKTTEAAIKRLRGAYPTLFRPVHGNADAGAGAHQPAGNGGGGSDMNRIIRRASGRPG